MVEVGKRARRCFSRECAQSEAERERKKLCKMVRFSITRGRPSFSRVSSSLKAPWKGKRRPLRVEARRKAGRRGEHAVKARQGASFENRF